MVNHMENTTIDPVEVTTRYATSVDELAEAWSFVMEHLEKVGPDPEVRISPFWVCSCGDDEDRHDPVRKFGVVVEGMVTQPRDPS